MPKQKDLKRLVRSRMRKTGESYTAARVQLVTDKQPKPDYAALAGMSDAAVRKQTGRDWPAWVATLDAAGAAAKPHREIARHVSSLGTPDWWSQMVTVGYERIRGLRQRGQRRGGTFEVSKSRTFLVPVAKLYGAFANARIRRRWLPVALEIRTSSSNKSMRVSFDDDTVVQFYFTAKGAGKSAVAVQHQKLPDQSTATEMKAWWTERLAALSALLL